MFSKFVEFTNEVCKPCSVKNDYIDLVISEYVRRKNSNLHYSERAFARDLGVSAGFLKLLFQRKKQLGFERAKDIALRLNWAASDQSRFLESVKNASKKYSQLLSGKYVLNNDEFIDISHWFFFAILEFFKVKGGTARLKQISLAFGLSTAEASFALQHLLKLGILRKKSASLYTVPLEYEIPSISSEGIKNFHRQMLDKAKLAIDEQALLQREFRGLTLAFDRSRIDEAKNEIQKFVSKFEKKFCDQKIDSVYQISVSFFRLDKEIL